MPWRATITRPSRTPSSRPLKSASANRSRRKQSSSSFRCGLLHAGLQILYGSQRRLRHLCIGVVTELLQLGYAISVSTHAEYLREADFLGFGPGLHGHVEFVADPRFPRQFGEERPRHAVEAGRIQRVDQV